MRGSIAVAAVPVRSARRAMPKPFARGQIRVMGTSQPPAKVFKSKLAPRRGTVKTDGSPVRYEKGEVSDETRIPFLRIVNISPRRRRSPPRWPPTPDVICQTQTPPQEPASRSQCHSTARVTPRVNSCCSAAASCEAYRRPRTTRLVEARRAPQGGPTTRRRGDHHDCESRRPRPAHLQLRWARDAGEPHQNRGGDTDEQPIDPGSASVGGAGRAVTRHPRPREVDVHAI